MGNKLYEEAHIIAIADAIRAKNGTDTKYKLSEMATAVNSISTSSGETTTDYVTPEQYGAKGDNKTDDTKAIQQAINSGKNVRLDSSKTYFIPMRKQLLVENKTGFTMSGGTIHRAAEEPYKNSDGSLTLNSSGNPTGIWQLFVINNCTDCTFEDMKIISEYADYEDGLVPQDHKRPYDGSSGSKGKKASNILAFTGSGNTGIKFLNNSFENMSADYWLNTSADKLWKNITIDGWDSHSSMMGMYAQYTQNLLVRNANVELSATYAGDGDHAVYLCTGIDKARVAESSFGLPSGTAAKVCVTAHNNDPNPSTKPAPADVAVSDCTINAGSNQAVYCGKDALVKISNSKLSTTGSDPITFGLGSMEISGTTLTFNGSVGDFPNGSLTLTDCDLQGATATDSGIFASVNNVVAVDSKINIGSSGVLKFANASSDIDYVFYNCEIVKAGTTKAYVASKRTENGSIKFIKSTIDCGGGDFIYNGGVSTNGFELLDSQVINCRTLSDKDGYVSTNSTLNGNAIANTTAEKEQTPAVSNLAITTQPSNVTVDEGKTAQFKVVATGSGLTYQWQYTTGNNVWNDVVYASGKTATLSLTADKTFNGVKTRCIVTDSTGNSVTSNVATLTVNSTATTESTTGGEAEPKLEIKAYNNVTIPQTWKDQVQAKWQKIPSATRQYMLDKGYQFYLVDASQTPTITVRGTTANFSGNAAGFTDGYISYLPCNDYSMENAVIHEMGHGLYTCLYREYSTFWQKWGTDYEDAWKEEVSKVPFDLDTYSSSESSPYQHHRTDQEEYYAEAFEYVLENRVTESRWNSTAPKTYQLTKDFINLTYKK